MQIAYNITRRREPIEYIVVHDTGNTASGANARSHFSYFNGGDRGSSADFFVDDREILCVNDYHANYTWHCGDGYGKYGITNGNSVGVELCINADGDYEKAFANMVQCVRELMEELGIDAGHVVRHYDASRKVCPGSFAGDGWARWREFKTELEGTNVPLTVQKLDNIYIQEIYPPDFGIFVCDCSKRDVGVDNYFNLGFFAVGSDGKTIPIGNLADCGNIISQAKDNADWINVAGKELTTLYVKQDGAFGITKTDTLEGKNIRTAVSGIPIVLGGKPSTMEDVRAEGYFGNECYDTWHGFLGLRGSDIVYAAARCDFGQMPWILIALGVRDAIKVDGGGSFILHNGKELIGTGENRRINNVGMWRG